MGVDSSSAFDRLVQKYFPQGRLLRAWPLQGGISAEMTALEIAGRGGQQRSWIVRRPQGPQATSRPVEDEFRLLEIIHSLGLASPAPLALDRSREIFAAPYMLIAYVEGRPDFAPAQPLDLAVQMAGELSRIHAVDGTRPDLAFLPRLEDRAFPQQPLSQMDAALDEGRIWDILKAAWPFPAIMPWRCCTATTGRGTSSGRGIVWRR